MVEESQGLQKLEGSAREVGACFLSHEWSMSLPSNNAMNTFMVYIPASVQQIDFNFDVVHWRIFTVAQSRQNPSLMYLGRSSDLPEGSVRYNRRSQMSVTMRINSHDTFRIFKTTLKSDRVVSSSAILGWFHGVHILRKFRRIQ